MLRAMFGVVRHFNSLPRDCSVEKGADGRERTRELKLFEDKES